MCNAEADGEIRPTFRVSPQDSDERHRAAMRPANGDGGSAEGGGCVVATTAAGQGGWRAVWLGECQSSFSSSPAQQLTSSPVLGSCPLA